jgi:hypothetical protein
LNMFRILLLMALLGMLPCATQAQSGYTNNGVATDVVVDAETFVNNGEFNVNTFTVPWDSQNTRNFVNRGIMRGSLGFRLEHVIPGAAQQRHPADSFINFNKGQITGFDGGGSGFFINQGIFTGFIFAADQSFITINARSITNRGLITSGAGGVVRVHGETVDLSGSALGIDPLGSFSDFSTIGFGPFLSETNFFPDPGLYDLAWGIGNRTNMFLGQIIAPGFISSPPFNLTNNLECVRSIVLNDPSVWVRETVGSSTNLNIEVVAVQLTDTNVTADVRFMPFYFPNGISGPNELLTPAIELNAAATNLFTLEVFTNRLYVFDQLGSSTNFNLLENALAGTFRPAPFVVFRGSEFLHSVFLTGSPSNSALFPDIFDSPAYSNQVVTNIQAGYAMQVESLQSRLPAIPGVGVTNLPGRVEIRATDLTMTAARLRGEGLISIRATNFLDSTDSIVDVPRLALNLGATEGALRVQGLARESVQRLNGPLVMYSAVWTNQLPNPDTNAGPIEVRFHLTMLDASNLRGTERMMTHDLALTARSGATLEINDPLTVSDTFSVDSDNLTLNGRLVLQPGRAWSPTNLTRMANFTNNGFLHSSELAQFERANGSGYDNLINAGRIQAFATLVNADYFENRGGQIISTQLVALSVTNDFCLNTVVFQTNSGPSIGTIAIHANVAKFEGGLARTGGDIRYTGGVFKFNNHRTEAGGRLLIEGLTTLADTGPQANNVWTVADGFHLGLPRPEGDLLGTTLNTFAEQSAFIDHVWSGEDRGATVAGFENNIALGRLIIENERASRLNFIGATAGNHGLYVDVLQLEGDFAGSVARVAGALRSSRLNIYYAGIESNTSSNLTAETLNGLVLGVNGGVTNRLIWVPEFAGPNTSVDILVRPGSSETTRMNLALRTSLNLDSDGDGVPNRFDEFPLFADPDVRFTEVQFNAQQRSIALGFNARAGSSYVIETTTNLTNPQWDLFRGNLQTGASGTIISVTDQVHDGSPQRYYRVRRVP